MVKKRRRKKVHRCFPKPKVFFNLLNPKIPKRSVCIRCFMPNQLPVSSLLEWGFPRLQERWLAPATSTVGVWHMGQPFTSVVLGWVPISPMSNPHYCLSISCRHVTRTLRRSRSPKCFSHFCSTSFHLSSLTPWQSLISEDWRSL